LGLGGIGKEEKTMKNNIKVLWMSLDEISEKDRAFLWSYGLMQVDGFFSKICEWDNAISYPGKE